MRNIFTILSLGATAFVCAWALSAAERTIPEDERIWEYLMRHRQEMTRVTPKPYRVAWAGTPLCARPNSIPHSPHGEHWIHVFVSPSGTNMMATGKGTYPVGTVILKQKFSDAAAPTQTFIQGCANESRATIQGWAIGSSSLSTEAATRSRRAAGLSRAWIAIRNTRRQISYRGAT